MSGVDVMKLQFACRKEIQRVSFGSGICLGLMLVTFYLLSLLKIGSFDYRILLGGTVGTLVSIVNFTLLCLTIQNAAAAEEKKQMKARFQLSYNARLIFQAGWVVAAFLLPWFHGVAGAIPLLFPSVVIVFLQRGKRTASMHPDAVPKSGQRDSFEA